MGDGISDGAAFGFRFAAFDVNGDELGCTLAITHNGLREICRDFGHCIAQGGVIVATCA